MSRNRRFVSDLADELFDSLAWRDFSREQFRDAVRESGVLIEMVRLLRDVHAYNFGDITKAGISARVEGWLQAYDTDGDA